jgi:hypothetical protein
MLGVLCEDNSMPTEQLASQQSPSKLTFGKKPQLKKPFQAFSTKASFVPSQNAMVPSRRIGSEQAGRLSSQGLPVVDSEIMAAAAAEAAAAEASSPEIELFAPLETTDWKKYWPLAATAVGAIGLIFLLRRRKK